MSQTQTACRRPFCLTSKAKLSVIAGFECLFQGVWLLSLRSMNCIDRSKTSAKSVFLDLESKACRKFSASVFVSCSVALNQFVSGTVLPVPSTSTVRTASPKVPSRHNRTHIYQTAAEAVVKVPFQEYLSWPEIGSSNSSRRA